MFRIKYILLPQTIGPFNDKNIIQRAKHSIENADYIMTRDKASLDYVKALTFSNLDLKEYIDIAFFLPYKTIKLEENCHNVGINISSLLWHGGYTKNNQFDLKCDYQQLCKKTIDFFLNQENTKVYLIPHVVLQEREIENDYEVAYDLWREYSNPDLIIAPYALGPVEVKSFIAGLDFFIGARMHATIGSFSSGVPVVPIAYSRKFNGLFVETLSYPYIVDLKESSEESALNIIIDSYNKRVELKEIIQNRLDGIVAERKKALFDALKAILLG